MEGQWLLASSPLAGHTLMADTTILTQQNMSKARATYKAISLADNHNLRGDDTDLLRRYLWDSWTRYWCVDCMCWLGLPDHRHCAYTFSSCGHSYSQAPMPANARQRPPTSSNAAHLQGHVPARAGREIAA